MLTDIHSIFQAKRLTVSVSTVAVATVLASGQAMGQAAQPCFISGVNNTGTATGGVNAPFSAVSLSASQASTTQILQRVTEQRRKTTQTCPAGLELVDGSCQQVPITTADAGQSQTPPSTSGAQSATSSQSSSSTGSSGSSAQSPAPSSSSADLYDVGSMAPIASEPSNGAWFRGHYEYEKRSGQSDRKQHERGFQVGFDRQVYSTGEGRVIAGIAGGYTQIDQEFGTSTSTNTSNTLINLVDDPGGFNVGPLSVTLPVPTTSVVEIGQEVEGPTFSTYASVQRNNWFLDGLFKADFYDVRLSQTGFNVSPTSLTAALVSPGGVLGGGPAVGDQFTVAEGGGALTTYQLNALNQFVDVTNAANIRNPADFDACIVSTTPSSDINESIAGAGSFTNQVVSQQQPTERSTSLTYYTWALKTGRKVELGENWWWEPFGGIRYTYADFGSNAQALNLVDGHVIRLDGGMSFGRVTYIQDRRMPVVWYTTATIGLYSDVFISGFTANALTNSPSVSEEDEGKIRFHGSIANEVDFLNGSRLFTEVNGRAGEDLWAIGGKVGVRFEF